MAYTGQDMVDRIRTLADVPFNAFTDATAAQFLNDAGLEFANKTGYPEGTYLQPVTSGVGKYDVDSVADNWLWIRGVWFDVDGGGKGAELTPTGEADMDLAVYNWRATTGTPTAYMMVDGNTKMQLWPEPDATISSALTTRFTKKPVVWTVANLSSQSSDLPDRWAQALCWRVAAVALLKHGQDERAAYYMVQWNRELGEAAQSRMFMATRRVWRRGSNIPQANGLTLNAGPAGILRVY